MIRLFSTLCLMVTLTICTINVPGIASASAKEAKPLKIAMILWRGETRVEDGFRAYFADRDIPVDLQIFDIGRDLERIPDIIAEIRKDPPDLVYTWGTGVTSRVAGKYDQVDPAQNITDLPVVFVMVSSPWKTSIAAPAGQTRPNVTGATHIAPLAAQIQAIRAYRPMTKLGVVYNSQEDNSISNVEDLQALGAEMGFEVLTAPLGQAEDPSPDDIGPAVSDLAKRGADILYIGPDNFIGTYRDVLTDAGFTNGLAAFSATELEVRDGQAMLGLVSRYELVGRLAASKVESILLDGVSPSDIPVETLERFSYLINFASARRLEMYPPLSLLDYAEIIK
ncbi:ABC transporter substrate-binding protein [Thalassospira sp. HF15]|uniref:ABC transporter substrate-binding protein n=1 Tax=Thalassospira sp. HF15 TaxID=2722755 RepID=UPI0014308F8A|nr:ABC transporter substrate-binding protein [Thalassospira sp. HF15]NIY74353.1 ABC transporter substrate-binding protein [Thalassospira sp. HF15]